MQKLIHRFVSYFSFYKFLYNPKMHYFCTTFLTLIGLEGGVLTTLAKDRTERNAFE